MIDAADEDGRHARGAERSALRQLRLAEPIGALRTPADGAARLQRQQQPPAERIVVVHHGQADAGLLEQRRPAFPRRAEPARLRVDAAAAVVSTALGAHEEHRSTRCAAALTAYASGSNFGYPSSMSSRNDPSTFADSGWLRDHHADQHDRLVHVQRPELAQGAHLQHRGHADLEPRRPHDHDRRQLT